MFTVNGTVSMPSVLALISIPGLESVRCWIGIPFCATYIFALLGNSLLLGIIKSEWSLHEPMYLFLAMLGVTAIALSTCTLPKMLGIFWFHMPDIYFDACLLQRCLIHTFQSIESGILLAIALDCYVAVRDPLRHVTIFTHQLVSDWGWSDTQSSSPCLILIKCRQKYYQTTVVSHSYCEHTAIVKRTAKDVQISKIFGLCVAFGILGMDIIFITLSYIRIFITVFTLPHKESRLKAFNTCIAHICVFLQFLSPGFLIFTHRFGFHIPPYIHILLSDIYLLVPPMLNLVYGMKTKQI